MKPDRITEIDDLRGIAMAGMILIHTTYYFLSDKTAFFFWNYLQFAVQVFVFCSAFLFFQKTREVRHISVVYFLNYLKKRFIRLLVPYYVFSFFYFIALVILDRLSLQYVFDSVFLIAGIQINWLILLFLQLTVFIPILKFTYHKQKIVFFTLFLLSLFSAVFLLFTKLHISDRIVMWLPWLLVVFYTLFFVHLRNNKLFPIFSLSVSAGGFILGTFWLILSGHSLSLYDNKYPPNIYYILYGIFWIEVLYILAKRGVFQFFASKKLLHFLSKYSYSLFFIHFLILYICTKIFTISQFNWITFFLLIFVLSLVAQMLLNKIMFYWDRSFLKASN